MKKNIFLIILILIASIIAAGCTSSDGTGVQNVKSGDNGGKVENAVPTEQTTPPVKGSFKNPASMGETVVLDAPGGTYEVTVSELKRGNEANYVIKKANEFNSAPDTGYEYLLVKARVAFTKGDDPTSLSSSDFSVFCSGVECKETWSVLPKDYIEFGTGQVMPGATKEGWLQYTVPTGQEAIFSYQPNMFDSSTAYISLGK